MLCLKVFFTNLFSFFFPDDQIALLMKQLEEEKSKSADLTKQLDNAESTIKNVRKVFRDDQLNRLQNPSSKGHWDEMTIQNSIQDLVTTMVVHLGISINWFHI